VGDRDDVAGPRSAASLNLYDFTFDALGAALADAGLPKREAKPLWRALYRETAPENDDALRLSEPVRNWIIRSFGERAWSNRVAGNVTEDVTSSDQTTRKCVLALPDGELIETVIMSFRGRFTSCVSTQAGCAMGCVFCATGQQGFRRHLTIGEMVGQIVLANRLLRATAALQTRVRNVVLMGMGEPLHNYDAVMSALDIMTDRRGLNIGPRRITLSTVGMVPGILRLAQERRPYNLAVSLHATNDKERAELVPVTRRWPLRDLMAACRTYATQTGRKIFFEWTLIEGKNDSVDRAHQLAALLEGIDAHINLIPLNPTAGFSGIASAPRTTTQFQAALRARGIPSTVRQRRGIEMAAGCGQLVGALSAR